MTCEQRERQEPEQVSAQDVLMANRAPFQLVDAWTNRDGAVATVLFDSASLDPLAGSDVAKRQNGETDDFLLFDAVRKAAGDPRLLSATFVGVSSEPENGPVVFDLLTPQGTPVRSTAPTVKTAVSEGLAAVAVLQEGM